MKHIFFLLLCVFSFNATYADENAYYAIYRNAEHLYPIEKDFIVMLKPTNPDDLRSAGYIKLRISIITNDKSAAKELDAKTDIVRSVIIDTISGFVKTDLQGQSGKAKLAMALTASINAILSDSSISGVTFPDFVIQP